MRLCIRNGTVVDPVSGTSENRDLWISDGRFGEGDRNETATIVDASGCIVCPGLVDIHVHFREPGQETKEDIASGCRSAAAGGVTTVVTMANTEPRIDHAGLVEFVLRKAGEANGVRVCPAACATKGMLGEELTEMAELKSAGAVAVTDDGQDIRNSGVLRRVLEYAHMVGLPYLAHCEDHDLSEGGAMSEGYTATVLGIPGIPKAAEEIAIDRVCRIAELTGAHIHIQHLTTAAGVDIVRHARARGVLVTCECTPHHWSLTDAAVRNFDANAKMNPPLREQADCDALVAGLVDGTIDCIATDHAPHTATEKEVEFALAPFGIVGLETMLPLAITGLVEPGHLSLERVLALMTVEPARILGLPAGTLEAGAAADVLVFDPKAEWTIDPTAFQSRSHNSPFGGTPVRGRVRQTIVGGSVVYSAT